MHSSKTVELIRRSLPQIGKAALWLAGVVTVAVVGVIVQQSDGSKPQPAPKPTPSVLADDAPAFCTIRGIEDSGYLNAALTGRSPQVVAVAVWIVDEEKWYFETAKRNGQSWSAPGDPTHLWEVGQPGDPPQTSFIFAMLTRTPHTRDQLPGEEEGRRTIPRGFAIAGEKIPLQQRELLSGGVNHHC
jgi:hypothetical protein